MACTRGGSPFYYLFMQEDHESWSRLMSMTRRRFVAQAGAAAFAATAVLRNASSTYADDAPATRPTRSDAEPFGYCLNTSTIRGQNLPLEKTVEIASAAGFNAI